MAIGWTTTKTSTGYTASVRKIEYQMPIVVLHTAHFPTRAKAMTWAKKWALHYRRAATVAKAT